MVIALSCSTLRKTCDFDHVLTIFCLENHFFDFQDLSKIYLIITQIAHCKALLGGIAMTCIVHCDTLRHTEKTLRDTGEKQFQTIYLPCVFASVFCVFCCDICATMCELAILASFLHPGLKIQYRSQSQVKIAMWDRGFRHQKSI